MINSTERTTTAVVVGVADTPSGRAALRMAAKLAEIYSLPLHLVRVSHTTGDEHHGRVMLDDIARLARYVAPTAAITAECTTGEVEDVLLERACGAHTLLLGTAETDGVPGRLGQWCLAHARCPVLVVDASGRAVAGTLHASPFAAV